MTIRILYNGACPICSREIALYRRQAERAGADLAFDDLNAADLGRWGLSPDQAMRRLHAHDGRRRLDGAEAFRALWARLPGWRWLAWITGLPGIRPLVTLVYDRILAPWLYRRSCARGACALPR